ncbi:PREDICTED: protein ENHANCED DISEASE RESISTANCE 4-like [Tarenaya hassleriana]|uniref:protein ENHANCED DISEASE RESISTANCE 4-like n=1 Tax=Tarenaya hassleriana TaxID=28532 RepID=UPI00053C5D5C|nr:PREDICTED: protein ENHANCED DISEASE RESISTANCE 4-like [Tarenaya hassleriana]XP_010558111.1 PREDICTED: protein ENHANCED DISEASE RESISTANCE 4-like [Tarenaya hassleriana]
MATGTNPKVRFVKCPRCLRVLLENEDVPVYQCGGCFTILEAKKRNVSANCTPSSAEAGEVQPSESQRVSEVEGSTRSSHDMVAPSCGEFSTGQEPGNGQNGYVDSIDEQLATVKLSHGEQTDDIQPSGTSAGHPGQNEGGDIYRLEADQDTKAVSAKQGSNSGSSRETSFSVPRKRAESSPEILMASTDEVEQRQGNDYHGHLHGDSTDDLQSGDFLADKTFSAYDGSVSSSDGREDRLQEGQIGLFDSVDDSARPSLEGRVRGKSVMQDHSDNKEQGASSSAIPPEEKHDGNRHKNSGQNNTSLQLEGSGDRLDRHWRRLGTRDFRSYLPYYQKGPSFSSSYEHGSPFYHSHDDFDAHSRPFPLQMPPYGGRRHSGPGFDRMYHDISYVIHTTASDSGQTNRESRIPFSGESVMDRRHHVGHPSWFAGQLHTSYGSSYPGSPQTNTEPEYRPGWSREIVSDAEDRHRHGSHEVKTYLTERKPVAMRHVRPTAGGAPYTSCYHCSQTLHMPADFLVFRTKYHLLRCGACMNVLRFSLKDGTHLVPAVRDPRPESCHDTNAHGVGNSDTNAHGVGNSASGSSRNEVPKLEKRSSSAKNEELPVARGSPLHRLMGYSTVSQVFKVSKPPPSPRISDSDQTLKN